MKWLEVEVEFIWKFNFCFTIYKVNFNSFKWCYTKKTCLSIFTAMKLYCSYIEAPPAKIFREVYSSSTISHPESPATSSERLKFEYNFFTLTFTCKPFYCSKISELPMLFYYKFFEVLWLLL